MAGTAVAILRESECEAMMLGFSAVGALAQPAVTPATTTALNTDVTNAVNDRFERFLQAEHYPGSSGESSGT
jgi:hypothetical protein